MSNAICDNAYGVLGLLSNATQKEISRRVKELDRLMQIGESPSYEYDFGIFNKKRDVKAIKQASAELDDIKKQIAHSFFRVYVNSQSHAEILASFNLNSDEILRVYQKREWDFITKKNFAIMLSLVLSEYNSENASSCIELWFELLDSPNNLKNFQKLFLNDDELNINEVHFDGLKERLINELSRVFNYIAKKRRNNKILAEFISTFGTQNLDESIGKESFDEIMKAISVLDELDISADGVFDDDEKATLKTCLEIFTNSFDDLKNLGLYESSKALQMRDLVVEKIRKHSLDLHNNLSQSEESLNLTKFATKIAGTKSSKSRLEEDKIALERFNNPIQVINFGVFEIAVYSHHFKFNGRTITFNEVQNLSYSVNVEYVNGIKKRTTYSCRINDFYVTDTVGIVKSVANVFKGKNTTEEEFLKLLSMITFIAQLMAKKLYASLLAGNTLEINWVYITKDSYYELSYNVYSDKFSKKEVRVSTSLKDPSISGGWLTLYDNNGDYFTSFSLDWSNVIVLQELIKMLKNKNEDVSRVNKNFSIGKYYGLRICNDPEAKVKDSAKRAADEEKEKIKIIVGVIVFVFVILILIIRTIA